jgi:serine/threonine protein kinase
MIALMIGAEVHHYNILSQLGGGGMGVVYRAEDSRLGRTVALKFLPDSVAGDTQVLERFEREARAASRLNHPHICTVFDIGQWENRRFIVMELLEGRNVGEAVRQGALDIDDLIEIAIQLADALDAAHSEGIVHRDIKPANIMMSPRGHATLLDFGLAKQVGASTVPISDSTMSGEVTLTKPGSTLGTIA